MFYLSGINRSGKNKSHCSGIQVRQPRKKSILGWQSKKFKIKARKIPRNAAYLAVREIPRDAAQHRYWTFYEAIKKRRRNTNKGFIAVSPLERRCRRMPGGRRQSRQMRFDRSGQRYTLNHSPERVG